MTLRHRFINQTWWGKAIGACFGFLMGGPGGALMGILIGNFFDRGLQNHYTKPFWYYHAEKDPDMRAVFFQSLYVLLGYLAKADGCVSQQSIHTAQNYMHEMRLNKIEKKSAQAYFNSGKKPEFNLNLTLSNLKALRTNPALAQLFLQTLYNAIEQDRASNKKIEQLNLVFRTLNFAPIRQQSHVFEDFFNDFSARSSQQQYQKRTTERPTYINSLTQAYEQLKITPSASMQEVKRAYRKLMSQHHPDKLSAQGLSADRIKDANDKTHKIRKAYETICQYRGKPSY